MYTEINDLLKRKEIISKQIQDLSYQINELAKQREEIRDKISQLCCSIPVAEPTIAKKSKKAQNDEVFNTLMKAMKSDPTFIQRLAKAMREEK